MIIVKHFPEESLVYVTFADRVSDEELRTACLEVRRITDSYDGETHVTCSDVRELRVPFSPRQETELGEAVSYTRGRGMKFCVHIVDPTTTRGLQLARALKAARSADEGEALVATQDDAHAVLMAVRERLGLDRSSLGSIITAMAAVQTRLSRLSRP